MSNDKKLEDISRDSEIYDEYMSASVSNENMNNNITSIRDFGYYIVCNVDVSWKSLDHTEVLEFYSISEYVEFLSKDKYDQAEEAGKNNNHDWFVTSINTNIDIEFVINIQVTDSEEKEIYVNHLIENQNDLRELSKILSGRESIDLNLTDEQSNIYKINSKSYTLKGKEDTGSINYGYSHIKDENMKNYILKGKVFIEMNVLKPKRDNNDRVHIILESDNIQIKFDFDNPRVNKDLKCFVDYLGHSDLMLVEDKTVYVSNILLDYDNSKDTILSSDGWNVYKDRPENIGNLNQHNNILKSLISRVKSVIL